MRKFVSIKYRKETTRLLGFQWQGAPSKNVPGEYQVRFPGKTTLGQCACLYARAGLVDHLRGVGNRCESQKKKYRKETCMHSFISIAINSEGFYQERFSKLCNR